MNIGTLIKYHSIDGDEVYGIVTEYFERCKELKYRESAVQVYWMDDDEATIESIKNLRDPAMEYIEVISESR